MFLWIICAFTIILAIWFGVNLVLTYCQEKRLNYNTIRQAELEIYGKFLTKTDWRGEPLDVNPNVLFAKNVLKEVNAPPTKKNVKTVMTHLQSNIHDRSDPADTYWITEGIDSDRNW